MRITSLLIVVFISIALSPVHAKESWGRLIKQSMLFQAKSLTRRLQASYQQWRHPYMQPETDFILRNHDVWFDAYPDAMLHQQNQTLLEFLAQPQLWRLFSIIGIKAIHTGPMQKAGAYVAGHFTASVDGGFDPISMQIDKRYGTQSQYQQLTRRAKLNGGLVISDLVPGHTGKGIDFYLALKGVADYQGLYTLIEIPKQYWPYLPQVSSIWESKNLTFEQVEFLAQKKIIPGHLQRVLFSLPGKIVTGWDATAVIEGIDGKTRRYVYLHYFKPGQPTLNWLDTSFNAQRLISANIINTLKVLGAGMMRIDANPFLGIETVENTTKTHSEATALAVNASNTLAQLIRKFGGYSFQELNMPIKQIKRFMQEGTDFSYDFITRPAIQHAVLTGDARLLNTMLHLLLEQQVDVKRLEHAMQNHDEITYELVEFQQNPNKKYRYGDKFVTGKEIKESVLKQMRNVALKKSYNVMSGNGLCTTSAALVASRLDIDNPYLANAKQKQQIKQGMLLMLVFNAMLPGVLNLSGWDLVGALPLKKTQATPYLEDGDCRWLNRGAYSLLALGKTTSILPRATTLFGSLDEQLNDEDSFVSHSKRLLALRKDHAIADSVLEHVYSLKDNVVAFSIKSKREKIVTLLNFSDKNTKISLVKLIGYNKSIPRNLAYNQLHKVNQLDIELTGLGFAILAFD